MHISAAEKADFSGLAEGAKVSYDVVVVACDFGSSRPATFTLDW